MDGIPSIPNFIAPEVLTNVGLSLGGAALINGVFGKVWGIFNDFGFPILQVDSVAALEYQSNSDIAKYPVEKGAFASYNKVSMPSSCVVQFLKGSGGPLERGSVLTQIKLYEKSTVGFNIVSPEVVYLNYQITGFTYARTAQDGATMLTINVALEEVLEDKVDYSIEEVKNPSDSKTIDGGAKESKQRTSVLKDIFG